MKSKGSAQTSAPILGNEAITQGGLKEGETKTTPEVAHMNQPVLKEPGSRVN